VIGILVAKHFSVNLGRPFNLRMVPSHLACKEICPTLGSNRPEQRVFKELGSRPDSGTGIAHRERSHSGRFQLFRVGEEFGERHFVANFNSILLQNFLVIPQVVPSTEKAAKLWGNSANLKGIS